MRRMVLIVAALLLPMAAQAAWPDRPIRLIVPIAPGGSNDFAARLLGAELGAALGQPVVVENRPGAAGQIGMRAAAQSPPDGNTLVLANAGAVAITPFVQSQPGYDPVRDFAPVGMVMEVPILLVVRADLPARTPQELIGLMRRDPGAITFGSPGAGQTPHMAAELFRRAAGTETVIATYRGASPAANDLVAGVTQALFDTSSTLPLIEQGLLRPIAVAGASRSSLMPTVPTLAESGVPGVEMSSWFVLLAPAGTPAPILDRLNGLLVTILSRPDTREKFRGIQAEVLPGSAAQAGARIGREVAYWRDVVRQVDIR